MHIIKSQLGRAAFIGTASCASIAVIASVVPISKVGMVLLPGALVAALFFPEGIESNHGWAFLILAAFFDCVLFALIALFFIRLRAKSSIDR
ncbi:hypothetical protein [Edaphobacter acidisoli]|uniref:hypothetical protein n=1 Tax=Edaphobacter acidisoli TaxID=2040573 RepID=UPI0016655518|nr:hypothetical protein [Edaphobacter acidisoli]